MRSRIRFLVIGFAAGTITGILGSGGGMVLVPLLSNFCKEDEKQVFSCSLGIMLPICVCCVLFQSRFTAVSAQDALPYLIGGSIGGVLSVFASKRISTVWLHRFFGLLLLWSGLKCLFS